MGMSVAGFLETARDWCTFGFTHPQAVQLARGESDGLETALYADRRMSPAQMEQIRLGLMDGLEMEKVSDYRWETSQLRLLRALLARGWDPTDVEPGSISVWDLRRMLVEVG